LRDGRRVQLSTQPLPDQPGQLVFITDLTETRQLQDRVNHMKRLSALGNMAASLAHQIRTPLSAAMLYAANLANRTLKPESRSQFQQKLMARLQDLEADQRHPAVCPQWRQPGGGALSVQGLLAEVQAGAEAFCQQQGCALHLEAPEPDLCLLANSSALAGAINNLIANARQAGADSLLVSAVRSGNRVEMRVIDNGKGMAPSCSTRSSNPSLPPDPRARASVLRWCSRWYEPIRGR
jgi:two-component system sensor histidine kinase FlrB